MSGSKKLEGFIGPTYTLTSVNVATERCLNLYPESLEVPWEKARLWYAPTPGLVQTYNLPTSPLRGMFAQDGRAWAVAGDTLYELFSNGAFVVIGKVALDGHPVSMADNGYGGHQLIVISGGAGYVLDLISGAFTQITATSFPTSPILVVFIDGYFVVLDSTANTMHLSALFDGLTYSGLDVAQRNTSSDNLISMVTDHREIWLIGSKTAEAWYDTGAADFPFAPIPGSYTPQGAAAAYSLQPFDNTVVWVSANTDGAGMVLKQPGPNPQRISTHALEQAMASFPSFSDAESFTYQQGGHTFYVLYFPTANATWVYDASTSMWHERSWYNAATNMQDAHRARTHMFAFGMHLVGDRQTGQIYQWTDKAYDDVGIAIHRIRQSPHICDNKDWIFHKCFELDMEYGLGVQAGQGVNPRVALSWSNDGGHTWSNEYWENVGVQGAYHLRAQWRRLGRARDRVYRVRMTDPIPWRLIEAYLEIEGGTS